MGVGEVRGRQVRLELSCWGPDVTAQRSGVACARAKARGRKVRGSSVDASYSYIHANNPERRSSAGGCRSRARGRCRVEKRAGC